MSQRLSSSMEDSMGAIYICTSGGMGGLSEIN